MYACARLAAVIVYLRRRCDRIPAPSPSSYICLCVYASAMIVYLRRRCGRAFALWS